MLDVGCGRRMVGGAREFAVVVVRVVEVVRCTAGREMGLLVTTDFCFRVVGCGLASGSGLARAKGLSSSVVAQKILDKVIAYLWKLTNFLLR